MEIKNLKGEVIYTSCRDVTIKECVEQAVKEGVSLIGADLHGANFRDADLRGANLTNADLRDTALQYADLRYATLKGTDFRHADLSFADFGVTNIQDTLGLPYMR